MRYIELCSTPLVHGSPESKIKLAEDIFNQLRRGNHVCLCVSVYSIDKRHRFFFWFFFWFFFGQVSETLL